MKDELDKDASQAADEERGPLCGQRLAAARMERNILIVDVAKELHISEDKVEALEGNDFDALGAAVFAKGYIRKYAQLVGLAESDLLKEYEELASATTIEPVLKARPRPRREMAPGPWIAMIVIVVIAATAFWWFTERPFGRDTISPSSPAAVQPEPAPARSGQSLDADDGDVARPAGLAEDAAPQDDEPVETADESAAEAVDDAQPPEVDDDGQLRMLVTFSGDCWTEISDGNGRRLFFGLGTAGRTVELSGQAPFNALFGDAANVRLQVNGVDYSFRDAERRGRTARLTVGDN